MDSLRFAALFLSILVAASGCSGGSNGAPSASPSPDAGTTGGQTRGTVVDEEFRPIENATVVHLGGGSADLTDGTGSFRLRGLPRETNVLLQASHDDHEGRTLMVDLRFVETAEVRFVLPGKPPGVSMHETITTDGELECQVAFGSHHGFPGYYKQSCGQALPETKERVRVPVKPNVTVVVIELVWTPQSQAADIMGLTSYLSTSAEELFLGSYHNRPGDYYISIFTGRTPMEPAHAAGGFIESIIHVDPGTVDEHVPTNAGVVVQQKFTLYTTAFYGEPPSPSWTYRGQTK